MKNKLTRIYALFWAIFSLYLFLSFSSNPPNGFTGSPPTFNTCSSSSGGCHSGGSGTGNVMITGLPGTIMPNTVYPITVTVNRTNGIPERGGMQMNVLDANNQNFGTLSNPGTSSTVMNSFFEHNPAQFFGGNNSVTYTVDWTSPATGNTTVTMYAAAVLADGLNGNLGDAVVTTTSAGAFMGGGGVITVNVSGTNVSCFGGSNGTATASASGGGGPPYTFSWSNGMSGSVITGLSAGTYSVTVTNGVGGMGTGSINITQPASPVTASIINLQNIDCNNPVGSATAQGSGGTPGYSYTWSSGANTQTAFFSVAGTYLVTVTDNNGCTSTTSATISNNTTPPTAEAGPPMVIDCANPTTNLNGAGSSTGSNITYLWTTLNGNIVSGSTTLNPVVDQAGTYTLTVTNNVNGCTASDMTTVSSNTNAPAANAGPDMELTCNSSSVMLDGTASSSGSNITYLWTTTNGNILMGEDTPTPTVNAAGTYTLQVTNTSNGCTASDNAVVTNDTIMPNASAGADTSLTCVVTVLELDGSGSSSGAGFSYEWTTTNGHIVSGENTLTPTVDESGTYCIEVTDSSNSCTATDCVIVGEDTTEPVAEAGNSAQLTCSMTSVTLDGTASASGPAITYLWTTQNGHIVSGAMTATPEVDEPGIYTIEVTNTENGCSAQDSVEVTSDTLSPVADAGPAMALNCQSSSVELDGTGSAQGNNITYEWSGPGIVSGGNTTTPTVDAPGTYSIIVTDTQNGCTAADSTVVSETPTLEADIPTHVNADCQGASTGSATASATGGNGSYTYNWSNGANGQQATGLSAGSYTVTVTDEDDCTATASVSITEPDSLLAMLTATGESAAGANDGTAQADPSGGTAGYAFLWSNGDTTALIENLAPGLYCVTVTDANDCTFSDCITVSQFGCGGRSISFEVENISCFGENNGAVTASGMGFSNPLTFEWSNGETGATIEMLEAGTYTVTVTDSDGCSLSDDVMLAEPEELEISLEQLIHVSCTGAANGSAEIAVSGGTPAYTFEWSNGENTPGIDSLQPGTYAVTVTDDNECSSSLSVEIEQVQDTIPPEVVIQDITIALDENGNAEITAEMIDNGSTDNCGIDTMILDISAFTCADIGQNQVILAVADAANNCSFDEAVVTVIDTLPPVITCPSDTSIISTSCEVVVDYAAPVATDNCDNVTISLTGGLSSGSVFPSGVTLVTWDASDESGNTSTCSFEVAVDNGFGSTISSTQVLCNGESTGTATADTEGGSPPFSFLWDDPMMQSTQTATGLAAGEYAVTITDASGCSTVATVEVTEPDALIITVDQVTNETGDQMDGAIEVTVTGGIMDYSYEWFFNGELLTGVEDPSGLMAGLYTLQVTDANGCTAEMTVTVEQVVTVTEGDEARDIHVFPNPTSGLLHIEMDLPENGDAKIDIFGPDGTKFSGSADFVFSGRKNVFDLSAWPEGFYILRIVVRDAVVCRSILVVKNN